MQTEVILKQLQFKDCNRCGKRIANTAQRCGHCGFELAPKGKVIEEDLSGETTEEHHSTGGYDTSTDDFDYDEYIANEFEEESDGSAKRNFWWYVALFLLILFAVTAVLPIF